MTVEKNSAKKETVTGDSTGFASLSQRIEAFLIKHRKVILSVAGVVIASTVAAGIGFAVSENMRAKGLSQVDQISDTLIKTDSGDYEAAAQTALAELESLAAKKNIIGARANMLKAEILFSGKKFDQARDAWLKAADADASSYIAPLSWFNAAVCCEELGESAAAFDLYQKAANEKDFSLKTHALFNAGRVKDEAGDYEGAAKAYQELNDAHTGDSWANLAMTRILAFRAEGKIQ